MMTPGADGHLRAKPFLIVTGWKQNAAGMPLFRFGCIVIFLPANRKRNEGRIWPSGKINSANSAFSLKTGQDKLQRFRLGRCDLPDRPGAIRFLLFCVSSRSEVHT